MVKHTQTNYLNVSDYFVGLAFKGLTHIRQMLHSYRNQSIDLQCIPMLQSYRNYSIHLQCKSIHWFLYECNIGLIWVNSSKVNFFLFLECPWRLWNFYLVNRILEEKIDIAKYEIWLWCNISTYGVRHQSYVLCMCYWKFYFGKMCTRDAFTVKPPPLLS